MASYINPAELLRPYLQPFMSSVDKGIEQGVGLSQLGLETQKSKAMLPYYDAQTKTLLQKIATEKANEDKLNWLIKTTSGTTNHQSRGQLPQGTPKIPEIGALTNAETAALAQGGPQAMSPEDQAMTKLYLSSLGMNELLPQYEIRPDVGEAITIDRLRGQIGAQPIPGLTIPQKLEDMYEMSPEGIPMKRQVFTTARGDIGPIPGLHGVPRQNPVVILGQGGTPIFGYPKEGTPAIEKTDTPVDLAKKAMGGDKEAQALLDKLQGMKIDLASASGEARAKGYGEIRSITVVDNNDPNPITRVKTFNMNDFNALNKLEPGRFVQASQSIPHIEEKKEIGVRTGPRSANIQTAYGVFKKESPELISLRKKVQDKGLLPGEDVLKDVGAINQWIGKKTTDPDVAELQKKTKLLADTLQRTIGGTQGGQWAFEVAADILDPTYSTQAFQRIMNSHEKTMERMSEEYKNFGKDNIDQTQKINKVPQNAIAHGINPATGIVEYYDENGEVVE